MKIPTNQLTFINHTYLYFHRFFLVFAMVLLQVTPAKSQIMEADSLLLKVEEFGNSLLNKDQDTSYIANYSEYLTIKLLGVNKINYFTIKDNDQNSMLRFRPDRRLNLGLGVAYKWFALDLAFNVGITEKTDFLNSNIFDFQGTIFNNKQFISIIYQYYYGYQMSETKGITADRSPASETRDDIRSVLLGFNYTFAFNYDKFSLKAPFIFNEMQKKSAGSFLLGASFNMFNMVSDSSVIPNVIANNFDKTLHLTDVNSTSLSLGFGYMYTLVWKEHFFATASFIPSLGLNMGDYKTDFRQPYTTHLFLGLGSMNSIGYNSERLFGGIQLSSDSYNTRIEKGRVVTSGYGKIKLFFGYRFKKNSKKETSKNDIRGLGK